VTNYYQADGLGSITSLSNSAGSLAQTYTFDSFDKLTSSAGSVTNPFQYTGREFDPETNLYFYRARYYDTSTGRLISEDPTGFYGGVNLYIYVGNDPVEYLDPFGEIRYNFPPPRTVPPTGRTLAALQCLEHCLQCVTNNANLNLIVTGGAEQSGHSTHSFHYRGEAVDVSFRNPVSTHNVFQCGEACGFTAGLAETAKHHWHLQLTPGNGVPLLPVLLSMKPPCGSKCQ